MTEYDSLKDFQKVSLNIDGELVQGYVMKKGRFRSLVSYKHVLLDSSGAKVVYEAIKVRWISNKNVFVG